MATASSNPGFWTGGGMQGHRASRRTLLVAPCVVFLGDQRHVGLIRDISSTGLFAYSDFTPAIGETVRIILTERTEGGGTKTVTCHGVVVRVESKGTGAATGIALRVAGFEVI